MYFSGKHEFFQYDPSGVQRVPSVWKEQPFLESLLTFLEMDCAELIPVIRQITDSWESMLTRDDKNASLDAMKGLGLLGSKHIYLYLLYVRWYDRLTRIGIYHDQGSPEDQQMLDELRQLPEQLPRYQKQIQRFFDLVLDVDRAGREPQQQAANHYLYDAPKDPDLFVFRPIPLSFEPMEPGRCSPVLYPVHVPDMIDYSLRSCVERGITVRRCKNCGRYFPQTGSARSTANARLPKGSRPVGRPGPSSSGPGSSLTIRCSRPTAGSISGASPGSRPAASLTRISTPGASRPER